MTIHENSPITHEILMEKLSESETKIKYWVAAGVLCHVLALFAMCIPAALYFGRLAERVESASVTSAEVRRQELETAEWRRNRERWEGLVEGVLNERGIQVPGSKGK